MLSGIGAFANNFDVVRSRHFDTYWFKLLPGGRGLSKLYVRLARSPTQRSHAAAALATAAITLPTVERCQSAKPDTMTKVEK